MRRNTVLLLCVLSMTVGGVLGWYAGRWDRRPNAPYAYAPKAPYPYARNATTQPFEDVRLYGERLAGVKVGEKWGFVDLDGETVIPPQFEGVSGFFDGRAVFHKDGKAGFIDWWGNVVIEPQFDGANPFSGGLAAVIIGDKWGFIDGSGKVVLQPRYDDVGIGFSEGLCAAFVNGKGWGFIDRTGEFVIEPQFGAVLWKFEDGAVRVRDGDWKWIDWKGEAID